jgi:hypothetical protein
VSGRRAAGLVGAGALLATVAFVVAGVAGAAIGLREDAERLGIGQLRFRFLLFGQALGPALGLLVLVAGGAALVLRPSRHLAAGAFAAATFVSTVLVLGAVNDTALDLSAGARLGAAVQLLAVLPLGVAGAWLAWSAQAVADPAGEAPDGGLRGGDGVGEAEVDGLG